MGSVAPNEILVKADTQEREIFSIALLRVELVVGQSSLAGSNNLRIVGPHTSFTQATSL